MLFMSLIILFNSELYYNKILIYKKEERNTFIYFLYEVKQN